MQNQKHEVVEEVYKVPENLCAMMDKASSIASRCERRMNSKIFKFGIYRMRAKVLRLRRTFWNAFFAAHPELDQKARYIYEENVGLVARMR